MLSERDKALATAAIEAQFSATVQQGADVLLSWHIGPHTGDDPQTPEQAAERFRRLLELAAKSKALALGALG